MNRPRLLLADDHRETRELLRSLLQPEFEVIAEVPDGSALVSAAEQLSPDVIVTDISMPGLDGLAAAAVILHRNPAVRIVFVTVYGDPMLVARGLATGALGFVLKLEAGDELVSTVHAALRGERRVSQVLLDRNLTDQNAMSTERTFDGLREQTNKRGSYVIR